MLASIRYMSWANDQSDKGLKALTHRLPLDPTVRYSIITVPGRTRARTVTDQPSLLARIERAIHRLQNTHGLPLQKLGDGCDPEVVLRDCADDQVHMRRAL